MCWVPSAHTQAPSSPLRDEELVDGAVGDACPPGARSRRSLSIRRGRRAALVRCQGARARVTASLLQRAHGLAAAARAHSNDVAAQRVLQQHNCRGQRYAPSSPSSTPRAWSCGGSRSRGFVQAVLKAARDAPAASAAAALPAAVVDGGAPPLAIRAPGGEAKRLASALLTLSPLNLSLKGTVLSTNLN